MFKGTEFSKALEIARIIDDCCGDKDEMDWLLKEVEKIMTLKLISSPPTR